MKKPDGTIDFIGGAMNLTSQIIGLVTEFSPDKKQRKINVAIRRLKHRFKNVPVANYVNVNFTEFTEREREELIAMLQATLRRI